MSKKTLRRYQERSVENFIEWSKTDSKLSTLILPTGTGKTYTAAHCIENISGKKILWVAHRKELINQAYKTIKQTVTWTDKISIELGKKKADPKSKIIVGFVQTLFRSRKHLVGFEPDYIIIDEYHHMSEKNKTYRGLVDKFPNAKVMGMTATAFRFSGDDLPLGDVLFEMDIGVAIAHKYLVPIKAEILRSNVSIADVKTVAGDFSVGELSKAINVKERNELIIKRIVELVKSGRQGVVFGADVKHSKDLASLAREAGITVAEIYGDTPEEERDILVEKISNREIDCTFNNMVCTEGTDVPHWSFAVIARPTRSLGLYIQCVGRVLRTFEGKEDAIIVDIYDKLKVKQSKVTFEDMAEHGDMFGDKKRANNILTALLDTFELKPGPGSSSSEDNVAVALNNFPVFMLKSKDDRWTTDDDFMPITSWVISDYQRLITWTEESVVNKLVEETTWTELKLKPTLQVIKQRPIIVRHDRFGQGQIIDVGLGMDLKVKFDGDGWSSPTEFVRFDTLKVKGILQSYSEDVDKKKIDKVFYMCFPAGVQEGRLVEMVKSKKELIIKNDKRLSKEDARRYLVDGASRAGILPLVRSDAKWKKMPISNSQKELIFNFMQNGRIGFDLDLDSMNKGDASAVIEQVKWQKTIYEKFGSDKKDNLIGYDDSSDDV